MAPWDDHEGDTGISAMAFDGFDDEADTVTEQEALPPRDDDARTDDTRDALADDMVDTARGAP